MNCTANSFFFNIRVSFSIPYNSTIISDNNHSQEQNFNNQHCFHSGDHTFSAMGQPQYLDSTHDQYATSAMGQHWQTYSANNQHQHPTSAMNQYQQLVPAQGQQLYQPSIMDPRQFSTSAGGHSQFHSSAQGQPQYSASLFSHFAQHPSYPASGMLGPSPYPASALGQPLYRPAAASSGQYESLLLPAALQMNPNPLWNLGGGQNRLLSDGQTWSTGPDNPTIDELYNSLSQLPPMRSSISLQNLHQVKLYPYSIHTFVLK